MFKHAALGIVLLTGFLGGCAQMSDETIRSRTARVLRISPEDISISNKLEQSPYTFYSATVKTGVQYYCIINRGGILTLGLVNSTECHRV